MSAMQQLLILIIIMTCTMAPPAVATASSGYELSPKDLQALSEALSSLATGETLTTPEEAPSTKSSLKDFHIALTAPPSLGSKEELAEKKQEMVFIERKEFERLADQLRDNTNDLVNSLRHNAAVVVADFVKVAENLERQIRFKSDTILKSVYASANQLETQNQQLEDTMDFLHGKYPAAS